MTRACMQMQASNMRLLSRPDLTSGPSVKVVAASSRSSALPHDTLKAVSKSLPPAAATDIFRMPRYCQAEVLHALAYYAECGLAPGAPGDVAPNQAQKMAALTNGNAAELRRLAVKASLVHANKI